MIVSGVVSLQGAGDLSPAQGRMLYEHLQKDRASNKIMEAQVMLSSVAAAFHGGKSGKSFNKMISGFQKIAFGIENLREERTTIQALKTMINGS